MADEKQETPAERVALAVAGRKPQALPEVLAGDVAALCAAVPAAKRTRLVEDLAKGAEFHLRGLAPDAAAEKTVHCRAGDLAALVEAARANAQ